MACSQWGSFPHVGSHIYPFPNNTIRIGHSHAWGEPPWPLGHFLPSPRPSPARGEGARRAPLPTASDLFRVASAPHAPLWRWIPANNRREGQRGPAGRTGGTGGNDSPLCDLPARPLSFLCLLVAGRTGDRVAGGSPSSLGRKGPSPACRPGLRQPLPLPLRERGGVRGCRGMTVKSSGRDQDSALTRRPGSGQERRVLVGATAPHPRPSPRGRGKRLRRDTPKGRGHTLEKRGGCES